MRFRFWAVAAVIAGILLSLCGCGSTDSPSSEPDAVSGHYADAARRTNTMTWVDGAMSTSIHIDIEGFTFDIPMSIHTLGRREGDTLSVAYMDFYSDIVGETINKSVYYHDGTLANKPAEGETLQFKKGTPRDLDFQTFTLPAFGDDAFQNAESSVDADGNTRLTATFAGTPYIPQILDILPDVVDADTFTNVVMKDITMECTITPDGFVSQQHLVYSLSTYDDELGGMSLDVDSTVTFHDPGEAVTIPTPESDGLITVTADNG